MGWVIVVIVLGVVVFIAYRRYLPFRQFIKGLLGGTALVSPKRLDTLDGLLKTEQEKTKLINQVLVIQTELDSQLNSKSLILSFGLSHLSLLPCLEKRGY
ncbi:MAG: hypothetical protein PHG35_02020 [Dehalococcoidales bacterium]|nr:hypothetical protein [Dehalococcoidales bacterium]